MEVDSGQSEVKLIVLETVKILKQSSGPAASRLESKLKNLIEQHDSCKVNNFVSLNKIKELQDTFDETKSQADKKKMNNKHLKDELSIVQDGINTITDSITQFTQATDCRNQQVSFQSCLDFQTFLSQYDVHKLLSRQGQRIDSRE